MYTSDYAKLTEKYDRRRKLSDKDKDDIKLLYSTGKYTWRSLASMYNVSKSRIGQIVNPSIEQYNKVYHKINIGSTKYSEKERKRQKEYRKYKHQLFLDGKIQL